MPKTLSKPPSVSTGKYSRQSQFGFPALILRAASDFAAPEDLSTGDYVRWSASGGTAYGRITRKATSGSVSAEPTGPTMEGSSENPAFGVRVYQQNNEGAWQPTDTITVHRAGALTKVESLDNAEQEQEQKYIGLEIFRAGTHTDSLGTTRTWTQDDLNELVESYDPNNFKAPLIVSHDINGHFADPEAEGDDQAKHRALLLKNLAFGYPAFLRREGDSLIAYYEKISPVAVEWIRNGQITGISCSIYFSDAPSNPTPGKLSLRHVALLGVEPPAVKGMALEAAEGDSLPEGAYTFEDLPNPEGTAEHYAWAPKADQLFDLISVSKAAGEILSRLRDHLIAQEGEEVAEAVIPRDLISAAQASGIGGPDEVRVPEERDLGDLADSFYRQINELWERIEGELPKAQLAPLYQQQEESMPLGENPTPTPTPTPENQIVQPQPDGDPTPSAGDQGGTPPAPAPTPAPTPTPAAHGEGESANDRRLQEALDRIAALEKDRNSLVGELSQQRVQARRADWRAFVKEMNLPAALTTGHSAKSLPGITEHEQGKPFTVADFGASLDKNQEAWFKAHLESVGQIYKTLHQELTPEGDGARSGGEEITPERLAQMAEEYQAEQRAAGVEVSFPAALTHVENNL